MYRIKLCATILLITVSSYAETDFEKGLLLFESDKEAAYTLFVKSAGGGDVESMAAAGFCCEEGAGIIQNRKVAYQWYGFAVKKNPVRACRGRSAIQVRWNGLRHDDLADRDKNFRLKYFSGPKAYEGALQLLKAGRQPDAEDLVDRAIEAFPENQDLLFLRGVLWRSRFTIYTSMLYFHAAQTIDDSAPQGKASQLMLMMDSKEQVSEGFIKLRKLMEEHPGEPLYNWIFAIQCRQQNRFHEDGAKAFERILRQWQPGPVMVNHTYANLLTERLSRSEEALKFRRIALEQSKRSWTYQGLANTLSSLKRYEEAEPEFAKAAELDPEDGQHWRQWGLCLMNLERFSKAADVFRLALEADPGDLKSRSKLAECLVELAEYKEALDLYTGILKQDKENRYALKGLARMYRDGLGVEKDIEKADAFSHRSELERRQALSRSNPGHFSPVDSLFSKAARSMHPRNRAERDSGKALALYLQSYEEEPSSRGLAAFSIGNLYKRGGYGVDRNRDLAISWYEKAISEGAEEGYTGLISVYLSIRSSDPKQIDKALDLANTLRDLGPKQAASFRSIALVYAYSGRFEEAVRFQEKALCEYSRIRTLGEGFIKALEQELEKYKRGEKPGVR